MLPRVEEVGEGRFAHYLDLPVRHRFQQPDEGPRIDLPAAVLQVIGRTGGGYGGAALFHLPGNRLQSIIGEIILLKIEENDQLRIFPGLIGVDLSCFLTAPDNQGAGYPVL